MLLEFTPVQAVLRFQHGEHLVAVEASIAIHIHGIEPRASMVWVVEHGGVQARQRGQGVEGTAALGTIVAARALHCLGASLVDEVPAHALAALVQGDARQVAQRLETHGAFRVVSCNATALLLDEAGPFADVVVGAVRLEIFGASAPHVVLSVVLSDVR